MSIRRVVGVGVIGVSLAAGLVAATPASATHRVYNTYGVYHLCHDYGVNNPTCDRRGHATADGHPQFYKAKTIKTAGSQPLRVFDVTRTDCTLLQINFNGGSAVDITKVHVTVAGKRHTYRSRLGHQLQSFRLRLHRHPFVLSFSHKGPQPEGAFFSGGASCKHASGPA